MNPQSLLLETTLPLFGVAALMKTGEDHDFPFMNLVDDTIREAVKQGTASIPLDQSVQIGVMPDLSSHLNVVVEELSSKP